MTHLHLSTLLVCNDGLVCIHSPSSCTEKGVYIMTVPIGTVCSKGENYLLSFCLFVLVVVVTALFKKNQRNKIGSCEA